jgi:conjugal transfer ATP-binding protein TraC
MMLTSRRIDCVDTGKISKTYTVKQFPRFKPSIWSMAGIIGDAFSGKTLSCDFVISFKFHIFDDNRDRKLAGAKAKSAQVRARERGGASKKAQEDACVWKEVLSEFEQEHRLISTSMQVAISSDGNLVSDESDLMYIFQSKQGFVLEENTYLHMPSILSMIPFCATEQVMKDFAKAGLCYKLWSKNVVNLLPIFGESKGTSSKKMIFMGRRGQLMSWDQFANSRGNYNVAVIGGSGSGKSVLMQEAIASSLKNGRVWVVDVGRSYHKLCDLFCGEFVVFSKKTPVCLNPFSSAKEESFDSFRNFMKSFLYLMAHPGDSLDPEAGWKKSILDKAVSDIWRLKSNSAELQDIIDYLENMSDRRCHDMATQLFPFGRSGAWGSYFNGAANLKSEKNFIVFELEEISQDKHIQSLVFMLLINDVTEKMYLSDRKTPMTLVIDEAWDMLKGGHGGDIIESVARRARKYNGSLITGTQTISDYKHPSARAAFNNSYWQLMLSQDKSSITQAKKENLIELDDFEERLLKSVKTEHGKYSEVLIRGKSGEYALGRLILDKFSLKLFSTQPKDFADYMDCREKGMSPMQSIASLQSLC